MKLGDAIKIADTALTNVRKSNKNGTAYKLVGMELAALEEVLTASTYLQDLRTVLNGPAANVGDAVADKEKGGETASGSPSIQGI